MERLPATPDPDHHHRAQNPHQIQLLHVSKPVFSFSDLDTVKPSPTLTPIHGSLYLIVNVLSFRFRLELISFESGSKLPVVDVPTVVSIELPDDNGEAGAGCRDS